MYVNIKILAAFPWFQALNILVILCLSPSEDNSGSTGGPHMFTQKKASKIPKFSVPSNIPRSALSFTASRRIKASLASVFAIRIPTFRPQGRTRRDTGIGLDMYVVFLSIYPIAVCCLRW